MILRILFITVILLSVKNTAIGQCMISTEGDEITHDLEFFYNPNGEFEGGARNGYSRQAGLITKKVGRDSNNIQLYISSLAYNTHPIKPRKLTLVFYGGDLIELEAEAMDAGDNYYVSSFLPSQDQIKSLKTRKLMYISVKDHRTEEHLTTSPYPHILKEQIDCILKYSK